LLPGAAWHFGNLAEREGFELSIKNIIYCSKGKHCKPKLFGPFLGHTSEYSREIQRNFAAYKLCTEYVTIWFILYNYQAVYIVGGGGGGNWTRNSHFFNHERQSDTTKDN